MLEMCVDTPASLQAAISGGADRVELCSALALGGLSPSIAFAEYALNAGAVVHAMVRPRAGDFVYDNDEIDLILEEMRQLQSCGVQGLVVGATHADGSLDTGVLARLRDAAPNSLLVLHRAIDLAPDPILATETACRLGYDFILTSGGALTAEQGAETISAMVKAAGQSLSIVAGSGISATNAADIMRATGVRQIHGSASTSTQWSNPRILEMGFANGPSRTTNAREVAAMKAAMTTAGETSK